MAFVSVVLQYVKERGDGRFVVPLMILQKMQAAAMMCDFFLVCFVYVQYRCLWEMWYGLFSKVRNTPPSPSLRNPSLNDDDDAGWSFDVTADPLPACFRILASQTHLNIYLNVSRGRYHVF